MAKKSKKKIDEDVELDELDEKDLLEEEDEEPAEEKVAKIRTGEKDKDVYSEEGLEELEEDDEVEAWEEGFAEGAKEDGQLSKDAFTGEVLTTEDEDDIVEMKIKGRLYRFLSEENAENFKKKLTEKKKKED